LEVLEIPLSFIKAGESLYQGEGIPASHERLCSIALLLKFPVFAAVINIVNIILSINC
jgi:uncharacterized membrane protein